jgi:hypothetical protein
MDNDWILTFEKTDKLYEDFYKDDLYFINLKYIYINRNNDIVKMNSENFLMSTPNYITREEILKILKKNTNDNNINYSLLSVLRYNITLDSNDIEHFLSSLNDGNTNNFLTIIKNIDAISFEKTISMFQDLNDVIFIFYEKSKELKQLNENNLTKKIFIHSNNKKKTLKKQYKD